MWSKAVALPDGSVYQCEVAESFKDRLRGLMGRDSLPAKRGMLFIHPFCALHPFWMLNTYFPLDIVWMNHDGIVTEIARDTRPLYAFKYGGKAVSNYTLELPAGSARNVRIGDRIRF
jgi:uncharacterized protein